MFGGFSAWIVRPVVGWGIQILFLPILAATPIHKSRVIRCSRYMATVDTCGSLSPLAIIVHVFRLFYGLILTLNEKETP